MHKVVEIELNERLPIQLSEREKVMPEILHDDAHRQTDYSYKVYVGRKQPIERSKSEMREERSTKAPKKETNFTLRSADLKKSEQSSI